MSGSIAKLDVNFEDFQSYIQGFMDGSVVKPGVNFEDF